MDEIKGLQQRVMNLEQRCAYKDVVIDRLIHTVSRVFRASPSMPHIAKECGVVVGQSDLPDVETQCQRWLSSGSN